MIVHLLEYRVVAGHDVEVTGFLRHETLGQPVPDGLVARFVGRRLSHRGREHLAVTIWRDADSYVRGTDFGRSSGVPGGTSVPAWRQGVERLSRHGLYRAGKR